MPSQPSGSPGSAPDTVWNRDARIVRATFLATAYSDIMDGLSDIQKRSLAEKWFCSAAQAMTSMIPLLDDGDPNDEEMLQVPYSDIHMHADMEDAASYVKKRAKGGTQTTRTATADQMDSYLTLSVGDSHEGRCAREHMRRLQRKRRTRRGGGPAPKRGRAPSFTVNDDQDDDDGDGGDAPAPHSRDGGLVIEDHYSARMHRMDDLTRICTGMEAFLLIKSRVDPSLTFHAILAIRRVRHYMFMWWKQWHNQGHTPAMLQTLFIGCFAHVCGNLIVTQDLYHKTSILVDFVTGQHLFDPHFPGGFPYWSSVFAEVLPEIKPRHTRATAGTGKCPDRWVVRPSAARLVTTGIFHDLHIPHPLFEKRGTNVVRGVVFECARQYGKTTAVIRALVALMLHASKLNAEVKTNSMTGMNKNVRDIYTNMDAANEDRIHFTRRKQHAATFLTDRKFHKNFSVIRGTTKTADSSRGYDCNIAYVDESGFIEYEELLKSVAPHLLKTIPRLVMSSTPSHDTNHEITRLLRKHPRGLWAVQFQSSCTDCRQRGQRFETSCLHVSYVNPSHYTSTIPIILQELFASHPDIATAELYGGAPPSGSQAYDIARLRALLGITDVYTYTGEFMPLTSSAELRVALDKEGVPHYLDEYPRMCTPDRWSALMLTLFRVDFFRALVDISASIGPSTTAVEIADMLWANSKAQACATETATDYMGAEVSHLAARDIVTAIVSVLVGFSHTAPATVKFKQAVVACTSVARVIFTESARLRAFGASLPGMAAGARITPRTRPFMYKALFVSCDLPVHGETEFTVLIHAYDTPVHARDEARMVILAIDSFDDCAADNTVLKRRASRLLARTLDAYGGGVERVIISIERNSDMAKANLLAMELCTTCKLCNVIPVPRSPGDYIARLEMQPAETPQMTFGCWSTQGTWSAAYYHVRMYMAQNTIATRGVPYTLNNDPDRGRRKMVETFQQMAKQQVRRSKKPGTLNGSHSHPLTYETSVVVSQENNDELDDLGRTLLMAFLSGYQFLHYMQRLNNHRRVKTLGRLPGVPARIQ